MLPVVRSMSGSSGSSGREMPMAFLMPYTLLTSPGVTWLVSRARFPVTFSAVEWKRNDRLGWEERKTNGSVFQKERQMCLNNSGKREGIKLIRWVERRTGGKTEFKINYRHLFSWMHGSLTHTRTHLGKLFGTLGKNPTTQPQQPLLIYPSARNCLHQQTTGCWHVRFPCLQLSVFQLHSSVCTNTLQI